MNSIARIRKGKGGLNPGNSPADDHHRAFWFFLTHNVCLLLVDRLVLEEVIFLAEPSCEICYMPQRLLQCQEKCCNIRFRLHLKIITYFKVLSLSSFSTRLSGEYMYKLTKLYRLQQKILAF